MTLTDSGPRGPEYGPARLKRLVFNLLYPAVLGTFFVSLLPAAVGSLRSGFHLKTVLCILIVSHFVIDYLFSEEVRDYRAFTFLLDVAVIVLLYLAYSAVQLGNDDPTDSRAVSLAMAGVYGCFLVWEYLQRNEIGTHPALTVYESIAAVWFLVAGLLWPGADVLLAIGLAAATLAMVIVCGAVLQSYHGGTARADGKEAPAVNPADGAED